MTFLNDDVLGHKTLAKVTPLVYRSSLDNELIHGWYVTPPDFDPTRRYPLILEIHGGPHSAYGNFFSAEIQLLAASGYIVFYDKDLNILDTIKKNRVYRGLKSNVPYGTHYIKITDRYTLINIKRGLSITIK
jgi:hypothetical protein